MGLTERLEARIASEHKSLLKEAVMLGGRSLSDFVVSAALEKAEEVFARSKAMKLSAEQSELFVNALLGNDEPGERLKMAAERYKKSGIVSP